MKIKIEFTIDVIPENIQVYLDECGFDETIKGFLTSYFSSMEEMLDQTLLENVGLTAIVNNRGE